MNFTKKKRLLVLVVWTAFLSLIYWGFGNTEFTLPITYTYFGLCLVLSVLYVLVNGGIKPIMDSERKKEESTRKKYLADKAKSHPIKPKDKYRRFTVKKNENEQASDKEEIPRPNPLGLPEEKRALLGNVLLVTLIPFYLIFLLDWILLNFF